jgi:hypothetical protein
MEIAQKYPTQKTARGNLKITNIVDLVLWMGPGKRSNSENKVKFQTLGEEKKL